MQLRRMVRGVVFAWFVGGGVALVSQAPRDKSARPQGRPQPSNGGNRPGQGGSGRRGTGGGNGSGRPNPGGGNRPSPGGGNSGGNSGRPNPAVSRPSSRPGRPAQWGRPPQNRPSYTFRPNDRDYLRRHYLNRLRYINRARRPRFVVGGFFPFGDIQYISTLSPDLNGYLPPPPMGYQMGYFDGYVVVYDPISYFIANVVDLLQ